MTTPVPRHHMYLVVGSLADARAVLEPLGIAQARAHGDVWEREVDFLSIETVHEAREVAFLSARGATKFILLGAERLGPQAQQALLKLAEEPPPRTILALAVPAANLCLPTLRSRAVVVRASSASLAEEDEARDLARAFVEASPASRRLAIIGTIAKKDDATSFARQFVSALFPLASSWSPASQRALREAAMWLDAPAPHTKAILEYLALLPQERS